MEVDAAWDGASHYTATAACGGGDVNVNGLRDQSAPSASNLNLYPNIRGGIMPFDMIQGNYGAANVIGLVYSAYFNFAVLRNAINLLADFSVSRIHVKTTNTRLKTFIETWFESINLNQFMAQFFLEYYRSGNVFIYKFSGRIDDNGFNMLKRSYSSVASLNEAQAAKSKVVPIRYIILNPMQVYLQYGGTYQYGYVRMLSTYEIQRLKNPQTTEDVQMLRSFPEDIQRQIKLGSGFQYLFVPLDTNRLYYVFYRKQDYEPLGVPMAFPVMNDIEFKMALRRVDMALARQIEQVFLLVTAGRQADQWNQVPSNRQLNALQSIFQNQTIGRVLVADYTTKAEWVLPDMEELIGPGKYQQVDKDIREGLQFLFFGDEKFANASIKIKILIESLREGRRAFMETFLMPEVKKICEAMNFKNVPELEFEEVQIQDEALMARLYVQLAQLGLLTPEETFDALKTGMLPNTEESLAAQEAYKAARAKGLYEPLAPKKEEGASTGKGRPAGTGGTPATRKVATPIGQSKAAMEREASPFHFGVTAVMNNMTKMGDLRASVETALKKHHHIKELDTAQASIAVTIAQSIAFNEEEASWAKAIPAYLKSPKGIGATVGREIDEVRAQFDCPESPVDSWLAGVLLRSRVAAPTP